MNIDVDKYLNKINKSVPKKKKIDFQKIGIQILCTCIIFLGCAIICKKNPDVKDYIFEKIYNSNISFAGIKNIYDKYLGGVFPIEDTSIVEPVFNETLKYKEKSIYLEGVKLEVDNNYLVPVIESGLVVFVGEKEDYGNVVIIQGMDGIDIWYGNMSTTSVKLYDYIEKGSLLGEVNYNYLYLVYTLNGKYLNYEDYLN